MEDEDKIQIDNMKMMFFGKEEIGTPIAKEIFGREKWLDYGIKNLFPQEIIELYNGASPLFKSLVDRKVDLIAGAGFNPVESLKEFIDNEFCEDNLDVIARSCALDYVLFGAYYLKILWNEEGMIGAIEYMPLEKVRIQQPTSKDVIDYDGDIPGFYVSADWANYKKKENKPFLMCPFMPEMYMEYSEQLYYTRTKTKGMDYYTEPDYSPVLRYLKLEQEIGIYHLKSVQNGFLPGVIITNKQGLPPPHQREAEYNEYKKRLGPENANDFVIVWCESPESAPSFEFIEPSVNDDRFRELEEAIQGKIMRAMKFTPAVAGIETAGKLGSKDEVNEQLEMLQLTVIAPIQKIIEGSFNKLARVNGLPAEMELLEFKLFKEDSVQEEVVESNDLTTTVGGSQNVTNLIKEIKLGTLSREQVIAQLEIMYGFTYEQAIRLVGNAKEGEGLPEDSKQPATFLKNRENLN